MSRVIRTTRYIRSGGSSASVSSYEATITGDGSTAQFNITHSLGSRSIHVQVYEDYGDYELVQVSLKLTDTNTAQINFPPVAVPQVGENYKVIIHKLN